ncbi:MAG: tRNA isopentenyl-2-thiomethyl-A-37 hydroxylase MiaE, partial [Planctomycetota bacterium]|nr:tRNA isopentenyl-2-thiomethyl-A-37 hydroxylase MiaE [Planctomycetota bacterium]
PDELSGFYRELAAAEAKHHELFLRHAEVIGGRESVGPRVEEIAGLESSIVKSLPLAPRIH